MLINNRYRVIEELGKGGMGAVYLVEDALRDDQVMTLKMIRADLLGPAGRNLAQFKYEFAALGQLRHPNLVTVHDFGVIADSQEYFYTMEYVPGQDLPSLAAEEMADPEHGYTWLYEITVQVCRALQYIHSRGFIHYDVKPHNVRITPEGLVKLMDFGLIGEPRGEGQLRVRGTPEYIAPELVQGEQVDHRADLYSLGVSLYEIVTGRLPFVGNSSMVILRQHVQDPPDPPRHLVSDVPQALHTLILKLMAKDPENRYGSANEVIEALNQLADLDFAVETKETKRGYVQSGRFVGREFELARLQGLLMRTMQGQGRLILITGGTGVGKTRLVRELRRRAQMQRVLVCEGTCYEHIRAPYGPWVSVLSQVIAYVHYQSRDIPALQQYSATLVKLMPDLADYVDLTLTGGEPAPPPAGGNGGERREGLPATARVVAADDKQSLMAATADFLFHWDQPLMFALEDLQYADAETIELLEYLGRRAPEGALLLCGVYREHDVDEGHPLNGLIRQAHLISHPGESQSQVGAQDYPFDLLHLDPLSEEASADLLRSMLGVQKLPAGLLSRLMTETGGNPLFIESLMYSMVEDDLLWYDGHTWQVDVDKLTRIPVSIQEAARRRLERLQADSLELLQWAAVMGQWLDIEILAQVSDLAPDRVFGLLNEAARRHVLSISDRAGEAIYRFSTDQMQEAVYNTFSAQERAARHQRIGQVLRDRHDEIEIVESLAWHFERAGEGDLALRYSKMAADKARQMFANESAVRHYDQALALIDQYPQLADPQVEYEVLAGREDCYRLIGDRQAQQADLDEMARIAEQTGDLSRRIEVVTRQVTLSNLLGNQVEARRAAETALDLARQAGDPRLEADILSSLGQACYSLGDYDCARACHEQALDLSRELNDRHSQAANMRFLGRVAAQAGQLVEAQRYLEQALHLYRAAGDQQGEADALNSLGTAVTDYAEQRRYYEQSLSIRQAIGDRSGQAQSYNNLAVVYWYFGLYGRARDNLEQAVQIARDMRDRSSLTYYLESLGRVYLELGEYVQGQQTLEEGRALAIDIGDRWIESTYWFMLGRLALARGNLSQARQLIQTACNMQREMNTPGFLATSLAWLGATHLALDEWQAAQGCTAEAVEHLQTAGNAGDYPPQDVWWLHYQVLKAAPDRREDEPLGDEIWESLKQARESMMEGIANISDQGLRRNYLNKVKINRDIIIEWTRQSSSRATGEAPSLEEVTGSTEEWTASVGPDQVEDRLTRILSISAQMNETHDAELLLNYVMDQVIELSGAERGFLVLLDELGRMDFRVARGMAEDEIERAKAQISYTVLGSVAQSKAPVLLQDATTDERFGRQSSVLELNLRSVLCVPLISSSELIGMIYTDNRSVSGRFSQADVDLMSIFANQAAIAIENTRLYEETVRANRELEAWAQTLEQRVAERTAELEEANASLSRRAVQLETSSQVGRQITSILDLDDLLNQVVNLIQARFGYYFVSVWLLNERGDAITLHAGTGQVGEYYRGQRYQIKLDDQSIITQVWAKGTYHLVDDVQADPHYVRSEALPDARSELALPFRVGDRIIGALDILSNRPADFGPEDRMVLQTLADQITIAIRNAQLYKGEQHRRQLAESLEQAGRVLSSSLDSREVPGLILEQLAAVVPYQRGSVMLRQGNAVRVIAQRGFPKRENSVDLRVPVREGDVFNQVVSARRPVIVDDVTQEPGWQQVDWLPLNRSWLGVPLISQNEVIGMISLTRSEANGFSSDDAQSVVAFANQAAIALENARLYDEITEFNERLEQMVDQRTEELNRAYRTLERLDRTKSDFIGVAAHELRTPLTVIKGYTQVLETNPNIKQDQDAKDVLDGILAGTERLHTIVNSMLDVTKIDSETLTLCEEPVQIQDVIQRVRQKFESALRERRLTFTTDRLNQLPFVEADPDLLFKIFYHLIANAIKYTPDGGHISVTGTEISHGDGTEIELVVSDTGIGIDPEHHELIFEKFYQTGEVTLHSSGQTKFKGGGSGLGLAIVRGIVRAHGGQVWVESPGHDEQACPGSHFHVRMPVKTCQIFQQA